MTTGQIIEEFKGLSRKEQEEVLSTLSQEVHPASTNEVCYADPQQALKVADQIFAERPELFRKLAQ